MLVLTRKHGQKNTFGKESPKAVKVSRAELATPRELSQARAAIERAEGRSTSRTTEGK